MTPTQQRTEEGAWPERLWLDQDQWDITTSDKSADPDYKPYVPASRVTALELELERAKATARVQALQQVRDKFREDYGPTPRGFGEWIEKTLYRAEAVLIKAGDLREGQ